MPEEKNNLTGPKDMDERIGEEFADAWARAEEDRKRADKLAKEKNMSKALEKRKMQPSPIETAEELSRIPSTVSEQEQFTSLRKGDIGEEGKTLSKETEENPEDESYLPPTMRPTSDKDRDQMSGAKRREDNTPAKRQAMERYLEDPRRRQRIIRLNQEIKNTEQEIARLKTTGTQVKSRLMGKAAKYCLGCFFGWATVFSAPFIALSRVIGLTGGKTENLNELKIKTLEVKLANYKKQMAAWSKKGR